MYFKVQLNFISVFIEHTHMSKIKLYVLCKTCYLKKKERFEIKLSTKLKEHLL